MCVVSCGVGNVDVLISVLLGAGFVSQSPTIGSDMVLLLLLVVVVEVVLGRIVCSFVVFETVADGVFGNFVVCKGELVLTCEVVLGMVDCDEVVMDTLVGVIVVPAYDCVHTGSVVVSVSLARVLFGNGRTVDCNSGWPVLTGVLSCGVVLPLSTCHEGFVFAMFSVVSPGGGDVFVLCSTSHRHVFLSDVSVVVSFSIKRDKTSHF